MYCSLRLRHLRGSGEVTFTSDPQVRYDRLSGRWFLVIIDVTLNAPTGAITKPNRVLMAVDDGANNGSIYSRHGLDVGSVPRRFHSLHRLRVPGSPAPRVSAGMTYDNDRSRSVLFGGSSRTIRTCAILGSCTNIPDLKAGHLTRVGRIIGNV
jgi:hypothetical protein